MILYKYVDLDTSKIIIKQHTVKFSHPYELNDPYEVTSLFYESEERSYEGHENAFNQLKIGMSYGILSLSRSPINPLMWAHYGRGKRAPLEKVIDLGHNNTAHGGMVIGIDTERAGFNCEKINLIPEKYGSVIYTTKKPIGEFSESKNIELFEGMSFSYNHKFHEALQRVFLYKSHHWSYEEEVRIVRNTHRNPIDNYGHRGIYKIDCESIKEIYIGSGHSHNKKQTMTLYQEIKSEIPNCEVLLCNTKGKSWGINAEPIKESF